MRASERAAEGGIRWVGCHLNPVGGNLKAGTLRSGNDGELPPPPSAWQWLMAEQKPGCPRAAPAALPPTRALPLPVPSRGGRAEQSVV